MRRRRITAPHPFGEINVTPLIDVVMCMIVFYLIVGKMVSDQRAANIRLPAAKGGDDAASTDTLVINIEPIPTPRGPAGGGGRIVVDRVEVAGGEPLAALIKERLAAKPGTIIQIRASRELTYGEVQPVVRAARQAGVGSIRLSTERVP